MNSHVMTAPVINVKISSKVHTWRLVRPDLCPCGWTPTRLVPTWADHIEAIVTERTLNRRKQ